MVSEKADPCDGAIVCAKIFALMDVICSMGGMRLFMSSVLNTWVMLEEGKLR